jgi:3-oxoacyl-[acyl-carrier-protein] synthase II
MEKGCDSVNPFFIPMAITNMDAGNIAIRYKLHGMCSCVVTAYASAANAIGDAFRHIRDGYGDVMVAGGAESSITPLCIGGFTSMKALCTSEDPNRASIPFDAERSGFVMGEGAGCLVLEEYEHAKKRGAHIYAELAGYGATCDAHHITAPAPDGNGAESCMRNAIADAGLTIDDIDYINAHGTSTHMNDAAESAAIRRLFGDRADQLKVSSTKSMTGHLLGASAAVEAVITAEAVERNFVPPTVNYKVPDPECTLDVVPNTGVEKEIRAALSNSFGFGGHNACLVFKKV